MMLLIYKQHHHGTSRRCSTVYFCLFADFQTEAFCGLIANYAQRRAQAKDELYDAYYAAHEDEDEEDDPPDDDADYYAADEEEEEDPPDDVDAYYYAALGCRCSLLLSSLDGRTSLISLHSFSIQVVLAVCCYCCLVQYFY
jgi:hypothetical protein